MNEMGWVCGTYGGDERCMHSFGWGNLRERDTLGKLRVYGKIILK